jgi:pimeloyl-ACP methyl ester carboxylesterase
MASFVVVLGLIAITFGMFIGAFLTISFAIRREDRRRSLAFDAPSTSTKVARTLVVVNGSRWE